MKIQPAGLPFEETKLFNDLLDILEQKKARNKLKLDYYNQKNRLKDLGISIPPQLKRMETVVGWPSKAVDALAMRSRFDGFSYAGTEELSRDIFGLSFKNIYNQAVKSELIHSCVFLTVSAGDVGEPPAIINAYSAMEAAAMWDWRKKRVKAGVAIADMQQNKQGTLEPSVYHLYTSNAVWIITRDENKNWQAELHLHSMGRPLIEPMVYNPSLSRPFGKSRISRAVMSITDSAVRASVRAEVSSEFFTAPQRYILGAKDDLFDGTTKLDAYIGAYLAITRDENGNVPNVGQFPQTSMQPHMDYIRSLAARFSGETNIPISELGVIHDNPASAEAMFAAKESLVSEAEDLNGTNGEALRAVALMALATSKNKSLYELNEMERSIMPVFKNPAMPNIAAATDSAVKLASIVPWYAETGVFWEELGFDEPKRIRLESERQRSQARLALQNLLYKEGVDATNEADFGAE